jgi:probable selenium-dependent hydroxylase accessory protein YqeC
MTSLLDVLRARSGLVCAVGAGGKKSTLLRLARAHPGRVLVTATTMIGPLREDTPGARVIADPATAAARVAACAREHRLIVAIGPHVKAGRHAGFDPGAIEAMRAAMAADIVLVKADGARMRLVKAPADGEPVLPPAMTVLVPVVSAAVIGAPLDERIAHRVERIAAITGLSPGAPIGPEHVGRLLAAPLGGLKGCGGAFVAPVVNMVDDGHRLELARAAARVALALTRRVDSILLASMTAEDPVVDVVRR